MRKIKYNLMCINDKYGGRSMNLAAVTALANAANELTMAEKGIASAKVILTGFVVVFAVLILLILIISVYGTIVYNVQNKDKKKKEEKQKAETAKAEVVKTETVSPAPIADSDGIPQEVVAVISAAVATTFGSSEKVRIKSIKKSSSGRSAWANAGVLNNTRPF